MFSAGLIKLIRVRVHVACGEFLTPLGGLLTVCRILGNTFTAYENLTVGDIQFRRLERQSNLVASCSCYESFVVRSHCHTFSWDMV